MPIKFDNNVMAFFLVVLVLLTIAMTLKSKASRVIKIMFQIILGGAFLIIFNIIAKNANITIPLNPISAFFAGVFQIPGVVFLLIIKYVIYI